MRRLFRAVIGCAVLSAAITTAGAQALRVSLPEGHEFTNPERQVLSISPDGKRFVYVAKGALHVKSIGGEQPVPIPGPLSGRGIANPVFSPDGQSVLYFAQDGGLLQRVSVTGGTPVTICQTEMPFGMSWGSDGQIVVGQGPKGILRVSANGGTPETIVTMKSGEAAHGPQILPGGETVLFTLGSEAAGKWDEAKIVVRSLKSGERKIIVPAGRDARYLPSGQLVYVSGGRIMAVGFDARTLQTSGQPVALVEGVQTARLTGAAQFAVSANGTVAYVSDRPAPVQLGLVSLDGTRKLLGRVPDGTQFPRVSPNGKQVTFAAGGDIYVADLSNLAGMRRVISPGTFPQFSPDGEWLAFGTLGTKRDGGIEEVFLQCADGSGEPELLIKPGRAPESWPAGDQGFSFITHRGKEADYDLWTYSLKSKEVTPLAVVNESAQLNSSFSPDMKSVAYMSSESGDWQISMQPFPVPSPKYQVTKQGGRFPVWSEDGKSLFYESNDHIYTAPFEGGATPALGKPVELPITGFIQRALRRNFELMPDGRSFLMFFRPGPEVEVISNWVDRLKQRVKAD